MDKSVNYKIDLFERMNVRCRTYSVEIGHRPTVAQPTAEAEYISTAHARPQKISQLSSPEY